MAGRLNGTVAHHCPTELEVDTLESNVVTIGKADVVRPTETRFQTISAHAPSEFVKAPIVIRAVLRLNMEVSDWRVMRSMLTVNLCAIREAALEGLTQDWIKWFVLTSADIQTTHRECDYLL